MDWADDVAYSVHDVEDAVVSAHLDLAGVDLDEQRSPLIELCRREYAPWSDAVALANALDRLTALPYWPGHFDGSQHSLAALKNLTSQLIGRFCQSAQLATRSEFGDGAWMLGIGHYRLFIVVVCAALTVALQYILTKTRFGSRLRASVDDQRVAAGLGINVNVVFLMTFAVGSGLAGLGGALSAEVLGLDPMFPLKNMIYFLIVVAVGGTSSVTGPLLASLLLGIGDVAGKYYVPKMGPFVIYTIMIVILIWRPNGLFGRTAAR